MSNASQPDHGQVAHIYAAAAAQAISRQDGPSFEEILAQPIAAARVFADEMGKRNGRQIDGWLGAAGLQRLFRDRVVFRLRH